MRSRSPPPTENTSRSSLNKFNRLVLSHASKTLADPLERWSNPSAQRHCQLAYTEHSILQRAKLLQKSFTGLFQFGIERHSTSPARRLGERRSAMHVNSAKRRVVRPWRTTVPLISADSVRLSNADHKSSLTSKQPNGKGYRTGTTCFTSPSSVGDTGLYRPCLARVRQDFSHAVQTPGRTSKNCRYHSSSPQTAAKSN